MLQRSLLIFILLFSTLITSAQGVRIESEVEGLGKEGAKKTSVLFLEGNRMKFQGTGEQGRSFLFDAEAEKFWMIDPQERTYSVLTRQQLEAMHKQMKTVMQQFEVQMRKMPEEQREQMKNMMEQQMGRSLDQDTVRYEKTGDTQKIRQWECTEYEGKVDGELRERLCTTSWKDLGLQESDLDVLYAFIDFFSTLTRGIEQAFPLAGSEEASREGYEGVPVERTLYQEGKEQYKTMVVKVEKKNVPDEVFTLPGGYEEKPLGQGMGGKQ